MINILTFLLDLEISLNIFLMSSPIAAIPAPEGYIVNFDNPARYEDITGYWAFGVGTVLSFSFLCMRIYTKVVVSRSFAAEDGESFIPYCNIVGFANSSSKCSLFDFGLGE